RERARQHTDARERERRQRQRRLPRQPREEGVLAAPDDHAVAAAGEVLTQTEDGLCGAGGTALVRQLQNGEGPVWHRPKVVILSRPCTSWWRRTSNCRRRVTAARSGWSSR